ncbi:aminoacyl-tRNA deacylase [Methylotenera mobilis]|uniref:YbaK/prolyl-tRNA synthetase associated region n=1 Tax=Methylotenera mobilis (strain JLW8 / ATCC BAA-1282 / DSM 17540) TaxID=583345 RepID=C6WWA5_METML|nr:YbaK/EbsC family protein [Methylotenera mobilis]ACT48204.1 YbaK/prolyl-tRNA synthetase associated region [Methylotenera mobilis JLW8]
MSDVIQSPVTQLLQQQAIPFDVIEIPLSEDKKPIRSLEELLTSKSLNLNAVVRSVVFKADSGSYTLLATAGGGRADWGILRKHLNERKLRMAEYDEVPEATGYVVGAVPPIALPETVRVLVDKSVRQYETVVIGSGVLGYAIALKCKDLLTLLAGADESEFVKV